PTTVTYTLSLHDALPISPVQELAAHLDGCPEHLRDDGGGQQARVVLDQVGRRPLRGHAVEQLGGDLLGARPQRGHRLGAERPGEDRKSTRLNSSHVKISY